MAIQPSDFFWFPKTSNRDRHQLTRGGMITPAAIVANTNNYAPPGIRTAAVVEMSSSASFSVTGLEAPPKGDNRSIVLVNVGSFDISLVSQSGSSLAANRFVMGAANYILQSGAAVEFYYNPSSVRWTLVGSVVSTGGGTSRRLTVSASGGAQFTTINQALTAAAALSPVVSATNPAAILIDAGIYAETVAMISHVDIWGVGPDAVKIQAPLGTDTIVTMAAFCEVQGVAVQGADGAGGIGVLANSGSNPGGRMFNCYVQDCTTGISVTTAGTFFFFDQSVIRKRPGDAGTDGVTITAGAQFHAFGSRCIAASSNKWTGKGISSVGAAAEAHLHNYAGRNADTNLYVNSGALIDVHGALIIGATTYGVHADVTGTSSIFLGNVEIIGSGTFDFFVDSANTMVEAIGSRWDTTLESIDVNNNNVLAAFMDVRENDAGFQVYGELHVGSHHHPTESVFGGGDSFTEEMTVLSDDGTGTSFVDNTTAAASPSGSTFVLFQGVTAGNVALIGHSDAAFPGIKNLSTVATVLGATGVIVVEVSDGAGGWLDVAAMATDGTTPYTQRGEDFFGIATEEHIRIGDTAGWGSDTINGTAAFWLRFRITTAITTSPTVQQIKMHTNRAEINDDGFLEFFGAARRLTSLTLHQRLTDDLSGASPANASLLLASGITITPVDNKFNNSAIDGYGGTIPVAQGNDTSLGAVLVCNWIPSSNNSNDVELEVGFAVIREGDVLDGTIAVTSLSDVTTLVTAQDEVQRAEFALDIRSAVPGDQIAYALFRDARASNPTDTFTGNVEVVSWSGQIFNWRE